MSDGPGLPGAVSKRLFDLALALLLLLPAVLIVLPAMAAIRLTSRGPAMFPQTRVGRGERPFTLYKLRTMATGTGDLPSHEAPAERITRLGRWLRRAKLDELPQIANVLRGEMSFVGPRPCLPTQDALIAARRRQGVYAVRPGVTGLAQVQGIDMSDPERLAAVDADYLRRRGFALDLALLWRTFTGAGRRDAIGAPRDPDSSLLDGPGRE